MTKKVSFGICAALLAVFAFHSSVSAASFDCGKATTPREKLICNDQALSDLDARLGLIYQQRRALLSPHGAELLQGSEQGWLRYVATVCPLDTAEHADDRRLPKNCLQREYEKRLDQLDKVGQKLGPFVFNRIDAFGAVPAPDDSGARPGFYAQHVSYPQIDNVSFPAADAWNTQAVKKLSHDNDCDGRLGDEDVDYVIGYANERIISTTWSNWTYCHGTPHGFGASKAENLVLLPAPHKFEATDLFGPGDGWIPKLQALFGDALQEQGWNRGTEQGKKEILGIVVSPNRWLFTAEGIKVGFNSYEGGCYACTPQPVTASWAKLKPLLVQDSVLP